MSVWKLAASILADVHLDRDSLHQRFTSISPSRANLTHLSARKKKNANCNRYGNILPFDHNCVKVMAHAAEGSRGRYINASIMQVCVVLRTLALMPSFVHLAAPWVLEGTEAHVCDCVAESDAHAPYCVLCCIGVERFVGGKVASTHQCNQPTCCSPSCGQCTSHKDDLSLNAGMQAQAGDPAQWRYIATQGPLQHTVHDFWHMVVEQRCCAIVMLTEVTEGTAAKCCQYFPAEPSTSMQVRCSTLQFLFLALALTFRPNAQVKCDICTASRCVSHLVRACVDCLRCTSGLGSKRHSVCRGLSLCLQEDDITVTCVSSTTLGQDSADIQKREMTVQTASNAEPFRCVHYQMLAWPDHGAPEETKPIQELLEAVNEVRCSVHAAPGVALLYRLGQ